MTHLERQLRDGIRRLLEAEPNPQARATQIVALRALLTLPNVAALLDVIDDLRGTLETARNGLQWYRDTYPEAVDGSDDEMDAAIEEILEPASTGVVTHPLIQSATECNKVLVALGKPGPRTCQVCGLGPCTAVFV